MIIGQDKCSTETHTIKFERRDDSDKDVKLCDIIKESKSYYAEETLVFEESLKKMKNP